MYVCQVAPSKTRRAPVGASHTRPALSTPSAFTRLPLSRSSDGVSLPPDPSYRPARPPYRPTGRRSHVLGERQDVVAAGRPALLAVNTSHRSGTSVAACGVHRARPMIRGHRHPAILQRSEPRCTVLLGSGVVSAVRCDQGSAHDRGAKGIEPSYRRAAPPPISPTTIQNGRGGAGKIERTQLQPSSQFSTRRHSARSVVAAARQSGGTSTSVYWGHFVGQRAARPCRRPARW